jgi:hypothetical protein
MQSIECRKGQANEIGIALTIRLNVQVKSINRPKTEEMTPEKIKNVNSRYIET